MDNAHHSEYSFFHFQENGILMLKPSFDDMRLLENFGHSLKAASFQINTESIDDIQSVLQQSRKNGIPITVRGAGRSYNDVAMNGGGFILNMQAVNRIMEWNPDTGVILCEPGVTLEDLWQKVLPDGWWPPVVSGTMTTTLGGCLGVNIHGKNNYKAGTIGEHVLEFTALLPNGNEVCCTPEQNKDLFYAMIGGMGMLGIFTSITLQMKRMHSGLLEIKAWNVADMETHIKAIDDHKDEDYIVGWMDCTARGSRMGRGQIHQANYIQEDGQDSKRTLQVDYQTLPSRFFGLVPKSILHYFMTPFFNNFGMPLVNTAKYLVGRNSTYLQSHAAFHFLLDYVPNWELAYGRYGLIQYQSFIPKEKVLDAWLEMIKLSQKTKLPSYLGVTKRHRPDAFLFSHAVDGFSLALDFKVTRNNRKDLSNMLQEFDRIVLEAGGRFYFAKNSETLPETAMTFLGEEAIQQFKKLKEKYDPDSLLESDLFRRVFKNA
jgi:decaprenylphospho-beta-D-ribofuranose 2-oxidase